MATLTRDQKLKLYAVGGLTVVGYGGLVLRRYFKEQKQSHSDPTNPRAPNPSTMSYFIPLSAHRMFIGSYALSIGIWSLHLSSSFQSFCKEHIPRILTNRLRKSLVSYPPLPRTQSECFKLGQMQQQLTILEAAGSAINAQQIKELLSKATALLKASNPITADQLHAMSSRIVSAENRKSTLQSVGGLFRFVNVMWALSICGISATVVPVIYLIGKPLWIKIYNVTKKLAVSLANLLKKLFWNDTAFTVYRATGYMASWYFIYLGMSADPTDRNTHYSTTGLYMSLTGFALWIPMYISSMNIYSNRNQNINQDNDQNDEFLTRMRQLMTPFFVSALSMPLAIRFNSHRLGTLAVGSAYWYLFSVFLQFRSQERRLSRLSDSERWNAGMTVSTLCNVGLVALKLNNVDVSKWNMLVQPLCVFGCIGKYSSLLVRAWDIRNKRRQLEMVTALVLGAGVGHLLHLPALTSTASVYTVLFGVQKAIEFDPFWRRENIYFSVFGMSVVTWRLALYLHQNPSILSNLVMFE